VRPELFQFCHVIGSTEPRIEDSLQATARFRLNCPTGISGARVGLMGLKATQVDGLIRIRLLSGEVLGGMVPPARAEYEVPPRATTFNVFSTYARLGLEHIATGIDHLMFVTALVLLIGNWRRVLVAVTAFTLAHSITLALAALRIISVPIHATEALIALSILLIAAELLPRADPAKPNLTRQRPWLLAFAFGLLHGLGFASGLAEIGLPAIEIPTALLSFNLGVEAGQFACVALLLFLGGLAQRLSPLYRDRGFTLAVYIIGSFSAFWFIQRAAAL
jgi:hydrogenase/urease accessory protein HupE